MLLSSVKQHKAEEQLLVLKQDKPEDFIVQHKRWLLRKLYENRDKDGDVIFVFKYVRQGDKEDGEVEMQESQRLKCHQQVLTSTSEYFKGLIDFMSNSQYAFANEMDEEMKEEPDKPQTVIEIKDYKMSIFKAMLEFFYLGQTVIASKDIMDMLYLCDEYILPALKQAVEAVIEEAESKQKP